MALTYSNATEHGIRIPTFSLPGVDGKNYTLDHFKNRRGLLVVFMCNHCPYVIAVHERLSQIARDYADHGISVIGVNSNDPEYREADSFENMKKISIEWKLAFPYVFDETQEVARAFGAVCTPDPFLYENKKGDFLLRYRGRIDDSWQDIHAVKENSLRIAIDTLLAGKPSITSEHASMGCSIKWRK